MDSTASAAKTNALYPKNIIRFQDGIYGFESVKEFILLQQDKEQTIWSLQAADAPYPSLIAVNPFLLFPDYSPSLSQADLTLLGNPKQGDLCFLAIAVIKRNLKESVVNLKSPVVINVTDKIGRQIILENNRYPVRCRLFQNTAAGRN
ncbi:MAG: flagellar assembly protein FliW [Oscillospiraceae bacterium]|jgi:flagellar assembly factor FliW|nr:flagellar assembly protein FliW [Oscillospiraceae bacterium]